MKKIMKGCAIAALVLIVLGFVMAILAGTTMGASTISEVVNAVTGGKVNINLGNNKGWGISIGGHEILNEDVHFDITDSMIFDNDYEIYHGDVEKFAIGSDITKLDIEAGGCDFTFQQSEDQNFYIEAEETGKFQCYVKNETLYVKSSRTFDDWNDYEECKIILYIPADYEFEKADVELGAGRLQMGDIVAKKLDLEVGAGQLLVDYLQADECDIEVGMGELIIDDMQVSKMNAEVGMGHLMLAGAILENADVECSMGSIEFTLDGSEEEYDYTVEAAMGNVSVGGTDYSGLSQNKTVNNSGDTKLTLECAMGNIQVDFED